MSLIFYVKSYKNKQMKSHGPVWEPIYNGLHTHIHLDLVRYKAHGQWVSYLIKLMSTWAQCVVELKDVSLTVCHLFFYLGLTYNRTQ